MTLPMLALVARASKKGMGRSLDWAVTWSSNGVPNKHTVSFSITAEVIPAPKTTRANNCRGLRQRVQGLEGYPGGEPALHEYRQQHHQSE